MFFSSLSFFFKALLLLGRFLIFCHFTVPWVTFEAVPEPLVWMKLLCVTLVLHSSCGCMWIYSEADCLWAPPLPFSFNRKCEGCKRGCALWGWARRCPDSWQSRNWTANLVQTLGLKMASQPHNRDLLRIITEMAFWVPKCVLVY